MVKWIPCCKWLSMSFLLMVLCVGSVLHLIQTELYSLYNLKIPTWHNAVMVCCLLFLYFLQFRCVHITAAGCAGVPAQCSPCCVVCGSGRAPGEEGAGCLCGSGKYWLTWASWGSHFTLTPSQTRMWFLTPSLNQCSGLWIMSLAGLARCVFGRLL